jgi:hypothetical protein
MREKEEERVSSQWKYERENCPKIIVQISFFFFKW